MNLKATFFLGILGGLLLALLVVTCRATEPYGQLVLDNTFVPNGALKKAVWTNSTGKIVYIHSAEIHMNCPVDEQWNVAWLTRLSDQSIVLRGGLYYPQQSPYLVTKNFWPDYVSLKQGDSLQLEYGAGYPNLSAPFRTYVVIWYSAGAP